MRLFKKIFLYFSSLIFILLATITFVQFQREKTSRKDTLDSKLRNYNKIVDNYLKHNVSFENLDGIVDLFPDKDLRITVINDTGKVLYDSDIKNTSTLENHILRPEFAQASQSQFGKSIRLSHSTNKVYYYYANKFQNYFVRSALPYTHDLEVLLKANVFFLYFMVAILFLALITLYFISKNFTSSIDRLRLFTQKAKNGEVEQLDLIFPKDELGEISKNMVGLYKQLAKTKNEVLNEREKLIKHFQISQEGLGIFSANKKEILVNSHFIQFTNFLTDKQTSSSEDIFSLTSFDDINTFINRSFSNEQVTRKKTKIEKDSKIFIVQCVVFQDNSFEITINDITSQEHENELKRQLTQNISHELKTPVASIMGYMESILDNPNLDADRKRFFIERSLQQSQRLSALLQDISTLNKIEEHRKAFDKELCNIALIVSDVLKDVHLQIIEKQYIVQVNISSDVNIRGNFSLIYSIFRNLMDNTLTYAGENILVKINCYREDEEFYYFTFSDNGIGVSEEHLNRIFERFYRIDKGRSRKMGGTGLGLAIVKNAIIYHKGNITAKSTPGGGLMFVFSLKKGKK